MHTQAEVRVERRMGWRVALSAAAGRQYFDGRGAELCRQSMHGRSHTMAGPMTRSGGYMPPSSFMRHVANPLARAFGAPTLTVRGRISGRAISTPVAPFEYAGDRYVIARRGETQWVRNLRIAGRCELRIRWRRIPVHATELRGAEHELVVAVYLERLGRRAASFLADLPNPADHPIFRLEPI